MPRISVLTRTGLTAGAIRIERVQLSYQHPVLSWEVNLTLPERQQLDEPPRPHHTEDEALHARESRDAYPKGSLDSTRSTYIPTDVNKIWARFGTTTYGHCNLQTPG
jgi:hypothetical protein